MNQSRSLFFLTLGIVLAACFALSANALDLVKDGKPTATIVLPLTPLAVESYAARELQYHIQAATGVELPITSESVDVPTNNRIYLGNCLATHAAQVEPAELPGNGYMIKTTAKAIYIAGKDLPGDPLGTDTYEGTLFGVYDLLERDLHVRWLWPGKLGEMIPHQSDLDIASRNETVKPLLWFKVWRGASSRGEKIWLKRQRFGRSVQPSYGHSFGDYWTKYHQAHPEYFAMLPDGTRRLDSNSGGDLEYSHMCLSEPGLTAQIIENWQARGTPEFLNVCENDGWAGCACPTCLSWDQPDPDNRVPFDQRLDAMKRAFSGKEGRADEWMLLMGSLSDRFAKFWERVSNEAVKVRPDVKVVNYIYDNYRKPPLKAKLNAHVLCGVVPEESIYGYSQLNSETFRTDWAGWEKTGCQLFLRPNYTLQMPNFPAFYAHRLGNDLKFALAHGLRGTDFDSLLGKYSVQGPSMYMLVAMLNHPEAKPDAVLEDFYDAFGPAKKTVKQYFASWESIYPNFSEAEQIAHKKLKHKYGAGTYGPFYILADQIFTPTVMANGWSLLEKARQEAATNPVAAERIEWLAKGLKQADLMLETERAYEQGVDSKDKTRFLTAYQVLKDYRASNAGYDQTNFIGLGGTEKTWDKAGK